VAERGTEDQQPQRRLHHPGDEFGPIVLQLLYFDDRERPDAAKRCADTPPSARGADQGQRRGFQVAVN
jgi:hypothetical protein